MAAFLGFDNYPVACIEHPISNNTEAENRHDAEEVLYQSIDLMLRTR
jgi:hypothetical protein